MKRASILTIGSMMILAAAQEARSQATRTWSGSSSGAWLTTANWSGGGIFAGATALPTPLAGEGAADDVFAVAATNAATNIGINMNTVTAGAGGLGLTLGGLQWEKTNATAATIGNSSTIAGGVLRLNGATIAGVPDTLVRVGGSANLTLANANTGTPTAAQTLGLELGTATGLFHVAADRILTLSTASITGAAGTGFTLSGGGQLVVNAPSTLNGPVVVDAGRLQTGNATALGSGPVTVRSGGQVYLTQSVANAFSIEGGGWVETAGTLGALRYQNTATSGPVTVTAPARVAAFGSATGAMNGPLLGSAALEINSTDAGTTGTIALNGDASGFSGPLNVVRGRFNVNTSAGPTGAVTVVDEAALGGEGSLGGALQLGTGAGAVLHVNPATPEVLTAAGNVSAAGPVTVQLAGTGPNPIRVLRTTGSLTATAADFILPGGLAAYRAGTGFDTTSVPGEVRCNLVREDIVWTGAAGTLWNLTDTNWTGANNRFHAADGVTFDDSVASGAVEISAAVLPSQVTVQNAATAFRFSGAGSIGGGARLLKRGTGTLTIDSIHTYTGGTLVEGGVLEVNAADALPAGITVSDGTLRVLPVVGLTAARTITLGDAGSGAASRQVVDIPSAATADQVVLSAPVVLTPGAAGKAILTYSGVTPSGGAPQFNGAVTLNGRDLWLENTSDNGGNAVRLWNMYGRISGTGSVHVDVPGPATRVRIGFNGNDFNGDVYIDRGMLQNGTGSGSSQNAIPNASLVIMAAGTRFGVGAADTIGALVGGAADPVTAAGPALVSPNISSTTVTLTIGGGDRSGVFDGTVSNDGTRTLVLSKTGAGTQVLNGDCSFTGNTSVTAGRFVINSSYTSAITVSGGATLSGTGTSSAAITATSATSGGANVAPGFPTGTLSAASANLSTGGNLLIQVDDAAPQKNSRLAVSGALNITGTDLVVTGTLTEPAYVIASYGTLTGTAFATVVKPDNYTVDYAWNDGVTTTNIALVRSAESPYQLWATSKGLTGADAEPGADPDRDGVINRLEFYFDANPSAGEPLWPAVALSGSNLRVTWPRRDDAETLTVVAEASESLSTGTWQTLQPGVDGVVLNISENGAAPDEMELLVPRTTERRYVRLRLLP